MYLNRNTINGQSVVYPYRVLYINGYTHVIVAAEHKGASLSKYRVRLKQINRCIPHRGGFRGDAPGARPP